MLKLRLHPIYRIQGKIVAPCSKSYAQRAIAIAACSKSPVVLSQYGESNDTKAALEVVRELGADFTISGSEINFKRGIQIEGKGAITLQIGEAGLSARLFSCFSLFTQHPFRIEGHGSILSRPMDMVISPLQALGKSVASAQGKLPLDISGKINNHSLKIDGSESSQFITGLLIVLPQLPQQITLQVHQLASIPYVEMTLDILKSFGINVAHTAHTAFHFVNNQTPYCPKYVIEGDWSGAAFLLVAGAIGGEVTLENLDPQSKQADRAILEALQLAGAEVSLVDHTITVKKNTLNGFEFDATHCPDLFPPLVALAAKCKGQSELHGLNRLANKESDRGLALQMEFQKVGIPIELDYLNDRMIIVGQPDLSISEELTFDSHNDHRIVMAVALFALSSTSPLNLNGVEAIQKSYPNFFEDLRTVSFKKEGNPI